MCKFCPMMDAPNVDAHNVDHLTKIMLNIAQGVFVSKAVEIQGGGSVITLFYSENLNSYEPLQASALTLVTQR